MNVALLIDMRLNGRKCYPEGCEYINFVFYSSMRLSGRLAVAQNMSEFSSSGTRDDTKSLPFTFMLIVLENQNRDIYLSAELETESLIFPLI